MERRVLLKLLRQKRKVVLRAKVEIENEKNEKSRLIISEIPYQVNKLTW